MSAKNRDQWGSKFGFIMAAAGSAVGLGNIWRFPYLVGMNGGGTFMIFYIIFAFLVGLNVMLAEFTLGRHTHKAVVGAYKEVGPKWTFVGFMGVLTAILIMGFYPVVGGWSLAYVFKGFSLMKGSVPIETFFQTFNSQSVEPLLWTAVYLAANIFIVRKGVSGGIEKLSKVLMPALFILLIIVAINGLTLDGAIDGVKYLFVPDTEALTGSTILAALGQAFFSLSLGMGAMITYGSFLNKSSDLRSNGILVTIMGVAIAILAALAMFPAMFAYDIEPAAGPGLVFIIMPTIFSHMGTIGVIFNFLFFVAFTIAALTSSVSLMEVVVDYFIEQHHMKRKKAVIVSALIMIILCTLSSLSMGVLSDVKIFGVIFFDLLDLLTDRVFMALGGLFLSLAIGWAVSKDDLYKEYTNNGTVNVSSFNAWYNLLKYVIPILIAIVSVSGIISTPQRGVMILGIVIVAILALLSKKLK